MAIFRPGAVIGAISGTLGGAAFVNSPAGPVVRSPRRRSTPRGSNRLRLQALFETKTRRWADETPANREAWILAAQSFQDTNRLGLKRSFSGFTLYMTFSQFSVVPIGQSGRTPPVLTRGPGISIDSIDFTEGGPYTITLSDIAPNNYNIYRLNGARSHRGPAITFFKSYLFVIGGFGPPASVDIQVEFDAALGVPHLNESVSVEAIASTPGSIPSHPTSANAVVHA